jgi:hypothetical protein
MEKKMGNKMLLLGILVMVPVFGMTVVGCDGGSGKSDYYGTWKNEAGAIRVISAREITGNVDSMTWTWSIDSVKSLSYPPGVDYKRGLTISGKITALNLSNQPWSVKVGDTFQETYLLHTDKKSFIIRGYGEGGYFFKQ